MTLYKKKYRVETTRLDGHHYADGTYFVTICTKKKLQWFGEIRDGKVELNEIGKVVSSCLKEIPKHFTLSKVLSSVVMPNHIHIIINICKNKESLYPSNAEVETRDARVSERKKDDLQNVSERERILQTNARDKETRASRVSTGNVVGVITLLGLVINQFKGAVTKHIHRIGHPDFSWQPRYHDHIIRSERELTALKKYISNNPECWDKETIPWHADAVAFSL